MSNSGDSVRSDEVLQAEGCLVDGGVLKRRSVLEIAKFTSRLEVSLQGMHVRNRSGQPCFPFSIKVLAHLLIFVRMIHIDSKTTLTTIGIL